MSRLLNAIRDRAEHARPLASPTYLARLRRDRECNALRQSDAMKTAVLHAVSHDFRSPLTAIRVATETLRGPLRLSEADRAALVETIAVEGSRLERLVDNLLDLSKLKAGAIWVQPEIWPVELLVAQALTQLDGQGARIEVALDSDVPPVLADAAHVERILVNLFENALKFSSPTDLVEISTRTARRVQIRVRDHGPGVPPEDRERIFAAFERANGARHGSGLGLAIARGFAQANSGQIWVEPAPERGAIFVVALPAAEKQALGRRDHRDPSEISAACFDGAWRFHPVSEPRCRSPRRNDHPPRRQPDPTLGNAANGPSH